LQEIVNRQEEIQRALKALEDLAEPEGDDAQRAQTLEDRASAADELMDEFDTLEDERKPLAAREARRARLMQDMQDESRRIPHLNSDGDGGGRNDATVHVKAGGRKQDPYKDLRTDIVRTSYLKEHVASRAQGTEYASRAVDVIEQFSEDLSPTFAHDEREAATALIQRAGRRQRPLLAAHVLLTGKPEYTDLFWDYMGAPLDMAQRAALSLTNANGGYLVPFTLDPTIILTNAGSANPFRQISNVKQVATNTWNGVASTGMNAAWLAEAGVVADASPSFSNIQITPQKGSAWVFGSYEILEDSDFETELPGLLADAKDRLEEAAFATGTGSGQPKGIVTAATTVYTTADTTGHTAAIADVYGIQAALPARFRRNASWVASISAINRFRQLDTAGGSSYWTNLGQGQPERLLGGGIFESTTVSAYTPSIGQLVAVYGDFRQFCIVDRIGMSVMYEPMVKDQATGRPTGQGGWFAFWRTGSDALVPGAFRTLKLA